MGGSPITNWSEEFSGPGSLTEVPQGRVLKADEVLVREEGEVVVHKRDCAIPLATGVDCTCKHKEEVRKLTLRGDPGIHNEAIINQVVAMNEPIVNAEGRYVGLTYSRLMELLKELDNRRTSTHELGEWLRKEFPNSGEVVPGYEIDHARRILGDAKQVIQAAWPHIVTLWGNISHVLKVVGIAPKEGS